jgi:hypothetical protein
MEDKLASTNFTAMLINAQEQRNLANKIIKAKSWVDSSQPKSFRAYKHLSGNTERKRDIVARQERQHENDSLIERLLDIMKRKPKDNGL